MTEHSSHQAQPEKRKRVLVVDDEPAITALVVRILKNAGFEAWAVNDALKASRQADEFRPDLIVLDFDMPKVTGPELCATLRTTTVCSNIPIIMLSGIHDEDHRIIGASGGAVAYLSKPLDEGELLRTIATLL